jgi:hypothetical protein
MNMKLAVAFAVLLFATPARADSVSPPDDTLIIPDGSTVLGISYTEPDPYFGFIYSVSYEFADGGGTTSGNFSWGFAGSIEFTIPVSSVTFDYFGGPLSLSDNIGDRLYFPDDPVAGTETFSGPAISEIDWTSWNDLGGITSLSYTVPEPSSLLLSGMGLAALIGLAYLNRTKGQKATL